MKYTHRPYWRGSTYSGAIRLSRGTTKLNLKNYTPVHVANRSFVILHPFSPSFVRLCSPSLPLPQLPRPTGFSQDKLATSTDCHYFRRCRMRICSFPFFFSLFLLFPPIFSFLILPSSLPLSFFSEIGRSLFSLEREYLLRVSRLVYERMDRYLESFVMMIVECEKLNERMPEGGG